ncbi:MAG: PqqD family peptide modification chaperone [Ruminococcaceae bacterium]|nr:PqqD family peptide modification chaperone [Oscillospiraceae bacterium]
MKIKNGYFLQKQDGNYIIEPKGKKIALSEIGVFLWELTSKLDLTNSQLLNLLLEEYEISTVLALGEIDAFIKSMKENGIFE